MMIVNRFIACLALSLLLLPHQVFAAAKPVLPDDRTLVSAIDVTKRTLDLTHQSHHITTSYVVAPDATFEMSGKSIDFKNVKVGMQMHLLKLGPGMDDPPVIEDLDLLPGKPPAKAAAK